MDSCGHPFNSEEGRQVSRECGQHENNKQPVGGHKDSCRQHVCHVWLFEPSLITNNYYIAYFCLLFHEKFPSANLATSQSVFFERLKVPPLTLSKPCIWTPGDHRKRGLISEQTWQTWPLDTLLPLEASDSSRQTRCSHPE